VGLCVVSVDGEYSEKRPRGVGDCSQASSKLLYWVLASLKLLGDILEQ